VIAHHPHRLFDHDEIADRRAEPRILEPDANMTAPFNAASIQTLSITLAPCSNACLS
jgi:hypothetical protein